MARRPKGPIRKRSRLLEGKVGPLRVEFWVHPHQFCIQMGDWYLLRGDRKELYQRRGEGNEMPRPVSGAPGHGVLPSPRKPSQVLKAFKVLGEYLADATWPDGTVMGAVQLSLRTRGSSIVAQLKMEDNGGLVMSVEGGHVDDALAGLEAALSATPQPWNVDPYPLGGAKKKPRK